MSKINKIILFTVVIIAAIVIAAGVFWYTSDSGNYYAVYLDTGDLYFGKLHRFPHLSLSGAWYLQREAQGQGLSLQDFSKAAWGPENIIELNKDKIVWMAKISDSSQLLPILTGKQSSAQIPGQYQYSETPNRIDASTTSR